MYKINVYVKIQMLLFLYISWYIYHITYINQSAEAVYLPGIYIYI
jgi:hypothetical protein